MAALGESRRPWALAFYGLLRRIGALRRFVVNRRIRSQMVTRLRNGPAHLQGETATFEDRYPELFAECALRMRDVAAPKVLSFGCATGEEVFTLARYLPRAAVVGVDINAWCLKQATARNTETRISFLNSRSAEYAAEGGFDAIFAMAVLQRTEHRTEGATPEQTGFTFARFDAELSALDRKLKVDGLLFLDECDFRFTDLEMAGRFEELEFPENRRIRDRPLFGRDNRRIADQHASPRAFRKRAD